MLGPLKHVGAPGQGNTGYARRLSCLVELAGDLPREDENDGQDQDEGQSCDGEGETDSAFSGLEYCGLRLADEKHANVGIIDVFEGQEYGQVGLVNDV